MSVEVVVLAGCAAGMLYAAWRRNQIAAFVLVALYAGIVAWIIMTDLTLLMPALGLAIALAIAALIAMLYRDVAEDVAMCRGRQGSSVKSKDLR